MYSASALGKVKQQQEITYVAVRDGEWIHPTGTWRQYGHSMRCCDCGLIHRMDFRIRNGQVEFRAVRDEVATATARREQKYENG
jgi:hypothetical protein